VESAVPLRDRSAKQAVGPDHGAAAGAAGAVDDQQMIAIVIESIAVALDPCCLGARFRTPLLEEHAIAQRLSRIDLVRRLCKAHFQVTAVAAFSPRLAEWA